MWFRCVEVVDDLVDLDEVGVVEDEVVAERYKGGLGNSGNGFRIHEVSGEEVGEVTFACFPGVVKMDSEDLGSDGMEVFE